MIQFAYTILYVEDVEATMRFYEDGLGLKRKFITPEKDYGEVLSGPTTIAFAQLSLAQSNLTKGFNSSNLSNAPFGVELGFTTEEPEKIVRQAIQAGAELYEPMTIKPWGQQVAYLRDIDGFLIEICTSMKSQ